MRGIFGDLSSNIRVMRILVTGGSGFIGSHLSESLIMAGHSVTILDNFSTGNIFNIHLLKEDPHTKIIEGDILDKVLVDNLIENSDYVFHLAAAVGVINILENPLSSLITNIRGTENILESCSKHEKPVFITSSSEVYGKNKAKSLSEDDDRIIGSTRLMRWSYAEAKALDESMALAYHIEKSLRVRIVRLFNTVGPRQLGEYGMVIPRFIDSAVSNKDIVVYGDGKQTRCFAHIFDVIEAINLIAFAENTIGKVINVGNNNEISILDLANRVKKLCNSSSEIKFLSYKDAYGSSFEDMEKRVPNLELIHELVGWKPKRSIDNIILDSI